MVPHERLAAIARDLAAARRADSLLSRVIAHTRELFAADAVLYLAHARRGLEPRAWSRPALADADRALAEQAWRHGRPSFRPSPRAALALPLSAGTAIRGVLLVVRSGQAFTGEEVAVCTSLATHVGVALEAVARYERLARQSARKLRETETLLAVTRALSSTLDLQTLLRHFLRRVAQAVGADSVGAYMLEPNGEWLSPLQGYRLPPDLLGELQRIKLSIRSHPFYAEGAAAKRPVFSADGGSDERIPLEVRTRLPHRSQLFVPIVAKDRVIGGLVAVWWRRPRTFSESELDLIEAVATQAGVALENARLFEENRRQVTELAVLHELSRAVTGQLDRAALIEAIHTQVAKVFDARNMVIALRDEAAGDLEVVLRVVDGRRDTTPPMRYPASGVGLMTVVLRSGRPVRTASYAEDCARHGVTPVPAFASLRHWLSVPMIAGEAVLGIVGLGSASRPFTAADERLLGNVAQLAALALRSARLYAERMRAHQELEAAQEQLVRTEKLRALGEMASGVAHDFNNLLAAILGRAQLLLRRTEDPKQREWLQIIEQSARDGAATVRRLQEFTRVRRDRPLLSVDVNAVIADALKITESRWRDEPRARGVAVEVQTSLGDVPAVAGDDAELREALTNLILNAVDAMPAGGRLTITTAAREDGVEVAVSDTGAGMADEVKKRIFEPFFTTKGTRGTGLGLSMTYGIVSRHGGRIQVESEEGCGSTFRLLLPRGVPVAAPAPAGQPAPVARGVRCLVVDDEASVGEVLADMLQAAGHQVEVFTDPARALERVGRDAFDIVFTDLGMPGITGWDVARAVKARNPKVPVVLITGYGVEISVEESRQHGVDEVLVKPIEVDALQRALARVTPAPA